VIPAAIQLVIQLVLEARQMNLPGLFSSDRIRFAGAQK
jgi:hypothetical protein